jgi:creatinine amidohydrolase
MELALKTWTQIDQYLQSSKTLIIPVGSTEQHGPTGLIGTDFITAFEISKMVGAKTKRLVAPSLNYGMANHHLAFAGSASLNPSTYILVIKDLVESWKMQGFKNFLFINGHGGNIAPLTSSFSEIKRGDETSKFSLINWWHLKVVQDYESKVFGEENGFHATCGEVAVTQFFCPSAFKDIPKTQFKIEKPSNHWPLSSTEMRQFYPDGRMASNPGLATPEHGQKIADLAADHISEMLVNWGF